MLKVYYGADRLGVEKAIRRELGEGYEVYEGENLMETDLPSIFMGVSLFGGEKRRILLKDVTENVAVWAKMPEYAQTEHEVIVWEVKVDKRSAGYKGLVEAGVAMKEFAEAKKPEMGIVFKVLDTALVDGARAVRMVEQIEMTQDPYMFFGLLVTQALKRFDEGGGRRRERKIVKLLGETDMRMKSSSIESWMLVKSCLLEIGGA